jgi:hypothetical protein
MATTAPASFAAVSKSSPFQPASAAATDSRASAQPSSRRPAPVVREVRVQADEPAVAAAVHARDRVPHGRRVPPRDPQVALAAELERRRAHVDRDPLRAPAAQPPELGRREPGRRDRRLRGAADPEGRRQHRIVTGERHSLQRRRITAAE